MSRINTIGCRLAAMAWPGKWRGLPASGTDAGTLDSGLAVLHFGHTPTLDYYFSARFPGCTRVDTTLRKPTLDALQTASAICLVRHIPAKWLKLLADNREPLPPVWLFLDDDIPGILHDGGVPLRYALKTAWRYGINLGLLRRVCDGVLVSTPELAARYALPEAAVLPPLPLDGKNRSCAARSDENVTIFYHGTASHQEEIRWLVPVMEQVMARCPGAVFEISGTQRVRAQFAHVPRVRVVLPMAWPSYLAYTRVARFDIGLAPLLDSQFNAVRSHVKIYDITRTGAVGVYSRGAAYSAAVDHERTGLLLENRREAWIEGLCGLVRDGAQRQRLAQAAAERVAQEFANGSGTR